MSSRPSHRIRLVTRLAALVVATVGLLGLAAPAGADPPTDPFSYHEVLVRRLAHEWRDPWLARATVDGLSPGVLAALEAKVPLDDVTRSPLLSYRARRLSPARIDSVIAFSFGNRTAPDGSLVGGPVNDALAQAVARFVRRHDVPVYAQTEIATALRGLGVADVVSIDPVVLPDGTVQYLSTAGVVDQVLANADASGVELGTVGVFGFEDHSARCVLTAQAGGLDAAVPAGVTLPSTYDPESAQAWTRSRTAYLPTDLLGRVLLAPG